MMKNTLFIALLAMFTLSACSDVNSKKDNQQVKNEVLFQVKDGHFTEWYAGKKQVKFEGDLDVKGNRDGKWTFYSEKGNMLSFTFYNHGKREGYSVVKYPNGRIHYHGDYHNDEMVGVWTTYDEKGKNKQIKDYGQLESE